MSILCNPTQISSISAALSEMCLKSSSSTSELFISLVGNEMDE